MERTPQATRGWVGGRHCDRPPIAPRVLELDHIPNERANLTGALSHIRGFGPLYVPVGAEGLEPPTFAL